MSIRVPLLSQNVPTAIGCLLSLRVDKLGTYLLRKDQALEKPWPTNPLSRLSKFPTLESTICRVLYFPTYNVQTLAP